MAYQLTPWGYEVDGDLPPLLTVEAFDDMTGGKWSGDGRIELAIASASAAIRDWCGWHVAGTMTCRATVDGDGKGSIWLPTTCLVAVTSIEYAATQPSGFQWSRIGQVLPSEPAPVGLGSATVTYRAGFATAPDNVAAIVAGLVVRGVALSYGVTQETAGGVSVSYAQGAAYAASSAALTDADRQSLTPYRVVRSHAA